MCDETLVKHCSPTLAGLKTANMFMYSFEDNSALMCDVCRLNKLLNKKGLRVIPLKIHENKALIYIYRPDRLASDLGNKKAEKVLRQCGYECNTESYCIGKLISRLTSCDEFPHEIGLFLGYPPEDVCGFIEKKECLLTGFWKVYDDPEKAEKKFAQFRKCTKVYYSCFCEGCPIEKLAVRSLNN